MSKKISIIIPTFKRTDWLLACLDGLKQQTFPMENFEVIVIDDATPDQGEKEKTVRSQTYPFSFQYHVQSKGGPAKARNKGLSLATAPLILFTDDDAIPSTTWVEEMYKSLQHPEASGVSGKTLSHKVTTWIERYLDYVTHLSKHHFGDDGSLAYIITVNAGFKRSALDQVKGFDEAFPFPSGEDMDLGFRMRAKGFKLTHNDNAIMYHRQRETFAHMFKTWFIYGRGAYMCAIRNKDVSYKGVTSSELKEFGKVYRTLLAYLRQIGNNLKNKNIKKLDAVVFPHLEIFNHIAYQLGRIYERLSQ